MATWIAHLRIAESILNKGYNFDPEPFVVGNIGPDSGVPNEEWSNFSPPKNITHWERDDKKINAQSFWDKYIIDFYLGENNETKDNFVYLNEVEMDNFIERATKVVEEILSELLMN